MTSSVGIRVASLIMGLMVLSSIIPAAWLLVSLRSVDIATRGVFLTIAFAALTLAWPIAVTLMTGSNDMLDPGRFALFPVRVRRLLPGLLLAAGMGLGGLVTVVLGLGYVIAWSSSLATFLAALIGFLIGGATCLVSSRALSSALSGLLRRRRARDLVMVVFVVAIIGFSLLMQLCSQQVAMVGVNISFDLSTIVAGLVPSANLLAWTPFGWAWALPWAIAQGSWLTALLWFGLAVLWLAGLAWIWGHQFAQYLVSPLDAGGSSEKIAKANPLDRLLPATPAGAIAKRNLRYWRRDPRRLVGGIAILLMPVIMGVSVIVSTSAASDLQEVGLMKNLLVFAPAFMGWMTAMFVGWDISYDGTALATQIVTGVSGRDDRWGRAIPFLIIFTPLQLAFLIGFGFYSGQWHMMPASAGICAFLLLAGVGIGSWMGSLWQVAQPPAGSTLVGRNAPGGVAGFLAAMVGMFLPLVAVIPIIVLAVLAAIFGQLYGWLALLLGLAGGGLILWRGIVDGGRRLDQRWPEVLDKVTWKG